MRKIFLCCLISALLISTALAEEVTTTKTVKSFFKENTDLRVAQESAKIYKEALNKTSLEVIQRATMLAKEDGRKTVLTRDIEQATEEVFRKAPMTISELMEKIKQLSIIDLAELSNQVKAYSEELLNKRKKVTVNYQNYAKKLSHKFIRNYEESERILKSFLKNVSQDLAQDRRVYFRGFGSFKKVLRPPRKYRNFKTGKIEIRPRKKDIEFKASKKLLSML